MTLFDFMEHHLFFSFVAIFFICCAVEGWFQVYRNEK